MNKLMKSESVELILKFEIPNPFGVDIFLIKRSNEWTR